MANNINMISIINIILEIRSNVKESAISYNKSTHTKYFSQILQRKRYQSFTTHRKSYKKIIGDKEIMKKEETNDIIQHLHLKLKQVNIPIKNIKQDVTTSKSNGLRGDLWISTSPHDTHNFWENIICLIEAKHKKCKLNDKDWKDAMRQGKIKAKSQNLNYYVVTNCTDLIRFYNVHNDSLIKLDSKIITNMQPYDILSRIQTQSNDKNSNILTKTRINEDYLEENFKDSLQRLAKIYRSCGIKKDDRIDPTVSFVILKYIGEKEKELRTLKKEVKLWQNYGKDNGNFKSDFNSSVRDIFSGEYGEEYQDFKELISLHEKLTNEHYKKIYKEFSGFHFHGCGFDVFGSIYEEFASQQKKKEFGEFYTRRHITKVIAKLLLKDEKKYRNDLTIGDPACGSGGFLTEAYKALVGNYQLFNQLDEKVWEKLKHDTFWGFDNEESSVARAKLNMFLVGDGHNHIYDNDSLIDWNNKNNWKEEAFDYIITNPPYGIYDGDANTNNFDFTNESRYELLFIEKIVKSTKFGGRMAIVVPDGVLESPSRSAFRLKLLHHVNIYAIISLTKFAFAPYTKEKTYVLFMERKAKKQVGTLQKEPIWHFIVDFDGFANSDKRYPTPSHNDLPKLENNFLSANYSDEVEGEKKIKAKSISIDKVNTDNYYNLLSEYHLRKETSNFVSETEFDNKVQEFKKELLEIVRTLK